ncbi:DUF4367 domain-containing protein [Anaerotignum faecicola]|nr:DUF4367 domain-containing protein [Anaerotignum faecicola]
MNRDSDKMCDDYLEFLTKKALDETADENGQRYIDELETIDEPKYSKEYKKEIDKLFKNGYYKRKVRLKKRKAAAVIAVFILTGSMALYTADADLKSFITAILTDNGTDMDLSVNTTNLNYDFSGMPESWDRFYVPGYMTPGYRVGSIEFGKSLVNISYDNGKDTIYLSEGISDTVSYNLDLEHSAYKEIDINGVKGYFQKFEDGILISWNYGGFYFQLSGAEGIDEMLEIAESMKAVER